MGKIEIKRKYLVIFTHVEMACLLLNLYVYGYRPRTVF